MPFVARIASEILRSMSARVIARSDLTDLDEGSDLLHVLHTCAEGIAQAELKMARWMGQGFFMAGDVPMTILRERARDLPGGGPLPLGPVAASGPALALTRQDTTTVQTARAGATFRRSDDPTVGYRLLEDATFQIGIKTVDNLKIVATTAGTRGNCQAGTITRRETVEPWIIAVTNTSGLYNGLDTESAGQYKARIRAYFASLARSQPSALLSLALSYQTGEGGRAVFARVFEDPFRPGFSEVIIDDGSGGAGGRRAGATTSGTVAHGGALILWHEAPATVAINRIKVTRGEAEFFIRETDGDYVSAWERGLVYVRPGVLQAGDEWEIAGQDSGSQYQVYTDLVAGLQAEIEGSTSEPSINPGWRASGTRVVVRPPVRQEVFMDLHIVPEQGVSLTEVRQAVKDEVVRYMQTLAPGAALYMPRLFAHLLRRVPLLTVRAYLPGTLTLMDDVSPLRHDYSLRTRAAQINIIPASAE